MQGKEIVYLSEQDIDTIINTAITKAVSQRLYNLSEAAIYLNLTEPSLLKIKQEVGFIKIGKKVMFKGIDLMNFIDKNYVNAC